LKTEFLNLFDLITSVHASCPIELSPPSVVVRYGDPVSVNCSTSEIQHGGMGWEATQGGRSLEYNVQHLTWTVENLTDWPISPSCFLNMPNEQCSRKPKVVLYTFPENISIGSSSGPDGVMREGHEYNITCLVHNVAPVQHLTVTWYKGDSPISRDTFDNGSKKPTDQPSVYSLTPTRRDNGATFRCEAQMDLGPEGPRLNVSSAEHSVTVHYGPELSCPSWYTALENTPNNLTCTVEGFPKPETTWYKDGEEVDLPKNPDRGDAGQYVVTASNNVSSVNVTVEFDVLCKFYRYKNLKYLCSALVILCFLSDPVLDQIVRRRTVTDS
uniref:Ig-like domain-containing protein n=1 Tax=Scophthalmus maximus TaxID=52904 RepID=A0A8D2ZSM5_SCOMX